MERGFLVALAIDWQRRTGLGWRVEHFISHFLFTLMFCIAWPRPFIVGAALSVVHGAARAPL